MAQRELCDHQEHEATTSFRDEVARVSSRTLPFASATLRHWLSNGPRHLEPLSS